ncbi:hypothetical protein GUITHDRAFT_137419 [Guillardia theta CCMP2712]|uniref:Anaphase-promoting complex subunit 5 n=1 Tax=Guillardia theta (strain CCMP2712) TaxID=905079 RepID=L1JH50_GUITC|nr:hypothetical protein GUITHDRAFT_137419 [Guillardia theta CCMP2712]EKX47662.1 hypothetical protein GUITHDRAFT_137419 [Guillardia theta CCMP2712]|eukprot:XP_005834642.1 hypothetical protein GUITHDRAFT_137419 [Guillardia theta CCMP2712]
MNSKVHFALSPHKVALSVLIQDLCTPENIPPNARPVLSLFLLEHVRPVDDFREMTLSQLCSALSQLHPPLGHALAHQLVRSMRKVDSPDALFDTLQSLELVLQLNVTCEDSAPNLNSSSALGIFVRKVLLTFHTTMFDGLSDLYSKMQRYLEDFSLESQEKMREEKLSTPQDLSHFIHSHASLIERSSQRLHIDPELEKALSKAGDPPGASYLRYLYAMQEGDITAAIDHLHRYFDYGMYGKALKADKAEHRDKPVFHWALLNLAALHFRFGNMAMALQALEECVRLAQHTSDHHCLAHALLWLVRLVGVAGERQLEGQLIRRCILRACQLRMTKLQGEAVLALLKYRLQSTTRKDNALGKPSADAGAVGTIPTSVWDALVACKTLLLETDADADELTNSLSLLESGIWSSYGHFELAHAHGRQPLAFSSSSPAADHACTSFCSSACHEGAFVDPRRALRDICGVKEGFPLAHFHLWLQSAWTLLFARSLYRNQLHRAQVIALQMGSMLISAAESAGLVAAERARKLELEDAMVQLSLACSLEKMGAHDAAFPVALACISKCEQLNLDSLKASAIVLLATLHLYKGLPTKALNLVQSVFPLVMSSGSILERAQAHHLDPCAILLLASTHLSKAVDGYRRLDAYQEVMQSCHLKAMVANKLGEEEDRERAASEFLWASQQLQANKCVPIAPMASLSFASKDELLAAAAEV